MLRKLLCCLFLFLALPAIASAEQQFTGATQAIISGSLLTWLLADPVMLAAIVSLVGMVASKVFKVDLSWLLTPLVSILKPSTPATPAIPLPGPAPVTPDLPTMLRLLLELLTKAKADGDKQAEDAAMLMLNRLSGAK